MEIEEKDVELMGQQVQKYIDIAESILNPFMELVELKPHLKTLLLLKGAQIYNQGRFDVLLGK